MKIKTVQRICAVLLAVLLLGTTKSAAFAANDVTPVLIVSGMGSRPMTDHETGKSVFPPETGTIIKGVLEALGPIAGTLALQNGVLFDKFGADAVHGILSDLACDENGNSIKQIDSEVFPDSMDHYKETFADATVNENAMVRSVGETVGWENTYFFNYDWRMNPLDIAKDLHTLVETIQGKYHSKISMIALSMGGNVTMAYLSLYGSEAFKTIVLASTAFLGVEMVGRMLAGDLTVTSQAVLNYFVPFFKSLNLNVLSGAFGGLAFAAEKTGTPAVNRYLKNLVAALKDPLYQKVFRDTFARFLGVWSFVPAAFYQDARALVRTYTTVSDSFLAKTKQLQDVQKNVPALMDQAEKSGTSVYIVGAYGFAGIPITKAANNHTDNLIDTHLMTGNCAVAPFGKTLADVAYDRSCACADPKHHHCSADGVIDASVGLRPERTWVIKGMSHVEFGYEHETTDLALWLLTSSKPVDVHSNARFPQFTELDRKTGALVSLTGNVAEDGEAPQSLPQRILSFLKSIYIDLFNRLFPKVF
ncbi:MAG: alpha/beta hydrolase [Clostridia bacterium]|nr:alpha/beta hydrolase [Clostridia bacterium]